MRLSRPMFVLLMFVSALVVRASAVAVLRGFQDEPSIRHGADYIEFNELAKQLSYGNGYVRNNGRPTAFRAPGFPLFLSVIYTVFGVHYPVVYAVLCLLGATSCVVTYLLAKEFLSEGSSRFATICAVLYFPHIYYATWFCSENLCIPLLGIGAWLFVRYLKHGSAWILCASGISLGMGALTRPFGLLLCPILLGVLVAQQLRWKRVQFAPSVVFGAAFVSIILPWTVRNYHVFRHVVCVTTNGGSTFYGSNNDIVSGGLLKLGTWVSTTELPGRDRVDATPNEVAHDKVEWSLGWQWVRHHPQVLPKLVVAKLARLLLPDIQSRNHAFVALDVVCATPVLAFVWVGLTVALRDRRLWTITWWALHGSMLATVVSAMIFYGCQRFLDVNLVIMIVYAAVGGERVAVLLCRRVHRNGADLRVHHET